MQREAMEFDVLIVGGGPAFLFDRVKKLASRASTTAGRLRAVQRLGHNDNRARAPG
jgi:hypothetical protein